MSDGALLGLPEIVSLDRWALERRSRSLASPVYLGDRIALCRILGRYKFYVDTDDVGFGAHVLLDGSWEVWLTAFMARRVTAGMRVVDVGANHGYYSVLFADLVGPQGRVAAIEPNPRLAALARRSLSVNGFTAWASVLEFAAGAIDGEPLRLIQPPDEPKNGRVIGPGAPDSGFAGFDVIGERLDTHLAHWNRVDFVKLDVEGAEEAAIAGLGVILERDRPDLVLEFNRHRCADPDGLLQHLEDLYGPPRFIDVDCEAHPVARAALVDPERTEDWMLYLSRR